MTQIASVDYSTLRITLHVDTVTQGFNPALMQQEYRALRRTVEANRKYDPMVSFQGLEAKGGGNFTPGQTLLRAGVRIIPHDADQQLDILNEILNIPDGLADRNVFDRTTVTSNVDIDPTYSPVEVREVVTGSAVTAQDKIDIINELMTRVMENGETYAEAFRLIRAEAAGTITRTGTAHKIKSADGLTDRIEATADENGRTVTAVDGT
jgi:hypothetical protein